jgi:REP element-mobilizing transposase RayT
MGNHYHLLVETPEANLSSGMRWLQSTYTIRHHMRHRLRGHLFQGRYKAILVKSEAETYFRNVSDYIHLNPARADLIEPGKKLSDFPWSSFPALIGIPRKRPAGLAAERVVCGREHK